MKAIFVRAIILSGSSSWGDIKAEMVTSITELMDERKINLKGAVCIPVSADKFAEGAFIFLGHWITYSREWGRFSGRRIDLSKQQAFLRNISFVIQGKTNWL